MILSITSQQFDLDGHAVFRPDPDSDLESNVRRLSRVPTLDGGCSMIDQGFSHADRTLRVRKNGISQTIYDRLWYLFRTYSLVTVSFRDGVFSAAIQELRLQDGEAQMTLLIKEKLS